MLTPMHCTPTFKPLAMQNSREDFRAGEVAQLVKGLSSVYDMTLDLLPSAIENQMSWGLPVIPALRRQTGGLGI